jgi:NhaP-type Na+/H+ or K+/H+ antiporter
MTNKILIGIVIGLVVGLVLGIAVSAVIKLPTKTGRGANNQVQVSGTVTAPYYVTIQSNSLKTNQTL